MSNKKSKVVDGKTYEYELYTRVDPHSDILKQTLEPFDFWEAPINPKYLAISLLETMISYGGIGMAANQVGLPYRVFVMGSKDGAGFACFNPEILESSGEETYDEGCISFPGLFLKVKRAKKIKVKYTDMNGVERTQEFDGLTARIFQHELDHLNGIHFTSKVSKTVLDRSKDKIKKNLKKIERETKNRIIFDEMRKMQMINIQKQNKVDNSQNTLLPPAQPIARELPKVFEYETGK